MTTKPRIGRRAFALGLFCLPAAGALLATHGEAQAQTYYDASGTVIIINPATLTAPVTVYNVHRQPVVIYPTAPSYVHTPTLYGPAGVRGQSRRVSRRTARRTSHRLN